MEQQKAEAEADSSGLVNLQPSKKKLNHHLVFSSLSLVVIFAVAAGIYFWQHSKVNELNKQVSTLSSQVSKLSTEVSDNPLSANSISGFIETFYRKYLTDTPKSFDDSLVKSEGTTNLANYLNPPTGVYDANPIICAQDIPEIDSVSVSNIKVTGNSATATVVEYFGTQKYIYVKVVNQSGTLKLDSVNCNPALKASIESAP